jgi:hypothetical protein
LPVADFAPLYTILFQSGKSPIFFKIGLYKYIPNDLKISNHVYTHINNVMFILMYLRIHMSMEVLFKSVSKGYPR